MDPRRCASQLAVASDPDSWSPNLDVLPTNRGFGRRERKQHRASGSLARREEPYRIVVVDFLNRPGDFLVLNGLVACTDIVYPAFFNEDGLDGATTTVKRYLMNRSPDRPLRQVGIVPISIGQGAVEPRHARNTLTSMRDEYDGLVLDPPIPNRIIVSESKSGRTYYGNYGAGKDD
jgi:cellulose biosynthesis protein BcsQ